MSFDPNKEVKPVYDQEWGTFVPERKPQWKYYDVPHRAQAAVKYSVNRNREAALYRYENDTWTLQYKVDKPKPGQLCAICKNPTKTDMKCDGPGYGKNARPGAKNWNHLAPEIVMPNHPAPHTKRPPICIDCGMGKFGLYGKQIKTEDRANPYDYPDIDGKMYNQHSKVNNARI